MTNEPYPSIKELFDPSLTALLPMSLAENIKERYATLGEKYMTMYQHTDGRFINGCMNKSSIQDAIEEVVDAVFNCLVWIFKLSMKEVKDDTSGLSAIRCLQGLIGVYSLLVAELHKEGAAAAHAAGN